MFCRRDTAYEYRISDWMSVVCSSELGAFSSFLVALFTVMYGFPLTIYLLSGWLQSRFPKVDWLSHDVGHLLEMLFGWEANPYFGPFHLLKIRRASCRERVCQYV